MSAGSSEEPGMEVEKGGPVVITQTLSYHMQRAISTPQAVPNSSIPWPWDKCDSAVPSTNLEEGSW